MFWLFFTLALLNFLWVLLVNWIWKKLPRSERVTFYCIAISGPVGWAIWAAKFLIQLFKLGCQPSLQRETGGDMDELEAALKEAQRNGTLSREKSPDFDDPDFDWESYESFKNLK